MPAKRAFREKWSNERYQATLVRDQIDAKLAHARWAGRHLAMLMRIQHNDQIGPYERGQLRVYLTHDVLIDYAIKEAWKHLRKFPARKGE